ncbi:MAG: HlyD family efflux transporter periplasmic adaptor subunit [Planctomycetota bacterium]|nr:HlyD family efflux transporter periplasmic adaptor subunit [Planctomycetota bacterium]
MPQGRHIQSVVSTGTPDRAPRLPRRKARGMARSRVIALVAVAGLALGGYLLLRPSGSTPATNAAKSSIVTADHAQVKRASFDITTTASGELEAKNQIEIRSPLEGEGSIVEIIAEGTKVKKGDVLIRLKTDDLQRRVDEDTLSVESAKADMIAAENGYNIQVNDNDNRLRQARVKLELAEIAMKQWMEGEVKTKRTKLQLDLSRTKLEIDRLAEKLQRSWKLHEQGFLSKDELEQDELRYIEAQTNWTNANLAARVYESFDFPRDEKTKISDVDQAKSDLRRVMLNNEIELASKESNRTKVRKQLSVLETKLAKSKQQLEAATVTAPADGLVVYGTSVERRFWGGNEGPLQIGRKVYPNELLVVLPDTSAMVASVRVHESLAGKVNKGQVATVKIDAAGGKTYIGEVDSIGVLAESGGWRDPDRREYTVKIALDLDAAATLKPSMRCEAEINMGRVDDAIAVPIQGVFSDGPVRYVYVPSDNKFQRIPVKLGRRSNSFAEILAGLDEGQTVLLRDPTPGETISLPWDKAKLELAGYQLDKDGQVIPEGGGPVQGSRANAKQAAKAKADSDKIAAKPESAKEAAPAEATVRSTDASGAAASTTATK